MRNQRTCLICLLFLIGISLLGGCERRTTRSGSAQDSTTHTTEQETERTITGVLSAKDEGNSTISVIDVDSGWIYSVPYDSYTTLQSRYEEPIAMEQLEIGQIIDVEYASDGVLASSIQVSYDAWEYEEVTGFTYDQKENHIWIMGEEYAYDTSLLLYDATPKAQESAAGNETQTTAAENSSPEAATEAATEATTQEALQDGTQSDAQLASGDAAQNSLRLSDISEQDTVTCRGYKGKICSVVLNSGHGYVRLSGYSTYIGGMISIGSVIEPVTEDMLLTVPVGNWTLAIDKDGKMGTKDIVVSQNEEQTVNLASLTIIACRRGVLHFVTNPEDCVITIDGVDYENRTDFVLEYGRHKIVVGAVDYKSYNGTINLNAAYINVNVELKKLDDDAESSTVTGSTTQAAQTTTAAASTTQTVQSTTEQTTTQETAAQTSTTETTN